jgi:hypothetical protein
MRVKTYNPIDIELATHKEVMVMRLFFSVPIEILDALLCKEKVPKERREELLKVAIKMSSVFLKTIDRVERQEDEG